MSGQRPRQPSTQIIMLGGSLLLGGLLIGLLAMHGVQASGPAGMPGIAVTSMNAMDPAHEHHDPQAPGRSGPGPEHQHPGGQVCLGLLVFAFMLALLALTVMRRRERPPALVERAQRLLLHRGRPPPSIYQLAVLRL